MLEDLASLWETPLDQRALAAVPDAAVPRCSACRGVKGWRELGIPESAAYFNGGVLLIHLERWRERGVTRRAQHYFDVTRGPVDFLHQEALNAVLWDDWKRLESRWNLLASVAGRSHEHPASDAWNRPGIVHFSGRMKPWRAPVGGPFYAPYLAALERVRPLFSTPPVTLRERFQSVYDRYLRGVLYPFERRLWRQRLL